MNPVWGLLELITRIPSRMPRAPNVSKRGVLLVTSAAGIIGLLVTAIYLRRKRKPLPAINPLDVQDKNANVVTNEYKRKKRKKPRSRRSDVTSPSGESGSQLQHGHHQDYSVMSGSSTVSSVKSSTSRHSRAPLLAAPGTKEYYDAERFYRLGVDAFESAMAQWERAGLVLNEGSDGSQTHSGRSSSLSGPRRRRTTYSESQSSGQKTPSSRSRTTSATVTSNTKLKPTMEAVLPPSDKNIPEDFVDASGDALPKDLDQLDPSSASEIEQKLFLFMERAEKLQKTFEDVLYSESETESDTDITLTGYDDQRLSDIDSDAESFVSAQDAWETRSLEEYSSQQQQHLALYEAALEAVDRGCVRCRTLRTDLLDCFSDVEFLAKLHCVRQALDLMLEDSTVRDWLIESGRVIVESILKSADHNVGQFKQAFLRIIEYVMDEENWIQIEDELKGRKVVSMTFYDIVLDFIIMDSFDDLDRPPSSVLSVLGNRWLANSIKESALSTAVWSVLKAKAQLLRYPEGFVAKFYAVSETISPVLAWGFLGTDEKLRSNCMKFKSEIISFLRAMFSFEQVRYTTVQQMSDDILRLTQHKIQKLLAHFETQQR